MKTLIFHGSLAKEFGKEWELDVETPMEALRAVEANTGKFRKFLIDGVNKNVDFMFKIDDDVMLDENQLHCKTPQAQTYHFMPVIQGGAWIPWVEIFKAIVVAVIAGIIMNALFKPPKAKEEKETKSFLFTGAENVAAQGIPVPLGYGRLRVGSRVVSAQMRHMPVERMPLRQGRPGGMGGNIFGGGLGGNNPFGSFSLEPDPYTYEHLNPGYGKD